MEERCMILWTASCKPFSEAEKRREVEKTSGYSVQHRFSLRYFPEAPVRVEFDGTAFDVSVGSYSCIPSEVKFTVKHRDGGMIGSYYDIIFLPSDPALRERLEQPHPPRQAGPAEKTMLNYIIGNWHRQDPEIQSNCNSFLTALLLLLFAPEVKAEALGSQFILTDGYHKATLCALDYIEKNFLSQFTLDELAEAVGYNKNYLCTSFTKDAGVSIISYTNFLRIRKAIGTVIYYPTAINHIASNLAFDNPNYFSRTFKAFTGISPRSAIRATQRMTPEDKANLYATEPLLKYRRCSIEEALNSMRHIGNIFKARAQESK